jgi:DNA-binding transcriptional ArsR family regulator
MGRETLAPIQMLLTVLAIAFTSPCDMRWARCLMLTPETLQHLLYWLILGTRGGRMRARIITALHEAPANANRLAELLHVDYSTIRHHLDILEQHRIVASVGDKYAKTYHLSEQLNSSYENFLELTQKL